MCSSDLVRVCVCVCVCERDVGSTQTLVELPFFGGSRPEVLIPVCEVLVVSAHIQTKAAELLWSTHMICSHAHSLSLKGKAHTQGWPGTRGRAVQSREQTMFHCPHLAVNTSFSQLTHTRLAHTQL